jgi:hypothetical protein
VRFSVVRCRGGGCVVAEIRPHWQTIRRTDLRMRPYAVAATGGTCPACQADVEAGDPIIHVGATTDVAPDGAKSVDLSGSVWVCDRHAGADPEEVPA